MVVVCSAIACGTSAVSWWLLSVVDQLSTVWYIVVVVVACVCGASAVHLRCVCVLWLLLRLLLSASASASAVRLRYVCGAPVVPLQYARSTLAVQL